MKRLLFVFLLVLGGVVGAQAQAEAQWRVQFYDNPYLSGNPALEITTQTVAFDWGTAAPTEDIPAAYFSARFAADVPFQPGTYRFYMLANDRAALKVDFQTYINTIDADEGSPDEVLTADVAVSGTTHVQLDFQKLGDNAYVYLDWERVSNNMRGPTFDIPGEIDVPPGDPVPVNNASWVAEYYTNPEFEGDPILSQTEDNPSYDWGEGAPIPGMPADNFSVRWTSRQYFDGSPHQFTLEADDGVRVSVNGVRYLDEWEQATGEVLKSPVFTLAEGFHNITVEFREDEGVAFIAYTLNKFINIPAPPDTTGTAVVTAGRLNVRNLPTVDGSEVLTKINRDETYTVIGRNRDDSWWLLDVNGIKGWVSGAFVDVFGIENVPVVDPNTGTIVDVPTDPTNPTPATPAPTNYTLTTTAAMNIFATPNSNSAIVGNIPQGQSALLLARSLSGSWFKIDYANTIGWISARFVALPADIDFNQIPIESS